MTDTKQTFGCSQENCLCWTLCQFRFIPCNSIYKVSLQFNNNKYYDKTKVVCNLWMENKREECDTSFWSFRNVPSSLPTVWVSWNSLLNKRILVISCTLWDVWLLGPWRFDGWNRPLVWWCQHLYKKRYANCNVHLHKKN